MIRYMLGAAVGLAVSAVAALATPLTLYYEVNASGSGYAYDFELVLDNNDGSWSAGQEFDWITVGDQQSSPSIFSEGSGFFTSLPTGFGANASSGFHNGPTLSFGTSVVLPGWAPSLNDSIEFSGFSSYLAAPGELLWSNLVSNSGVVNASFETAVVGLPGATPVPLPAGLPLLVTALFAGALLRRKQRSA